jgi:tRNA dimethylallyltransferase
LGYKEALAFIEGRMSEAEALDRITIETRQYAKRQLTWFRREAEVVWLQGFGHEEGVAEEAEGLVRGFLGEFTYMKVC